MDTDTDSQLPDHVQETTGSRARPAAPGTEGRRSASLGRHQWKSHLQRSWCAVTWLVCKQIIATRGSRIRDANVTPTRRYAAVNRTAEEASCEICPGFLRN